MTSLPIMNLKCDREIASGGFGKIYQTDNPSTTLVIKSPIDIKELDMLVKLKGHPYIIDIVGINKSFKSSDIEIIIERATMDGNTFIYSSDVIDCKKAILHMMIALEYIHSRNIVHRDIKPDNMLWFEEQNRMKITDFGISEHFTFQKISELTASTNHYKAPEVGTEDNILDFLEDIWSMGITIFEFIYKGSYPQHLRKCTIISPNKLYKILFPTISKVKNFECDYMGKAFELCELLSVMLIVKPSDRITAVNALKHKYFNPYRLLIEQFTQLPSL